MTVQAAQHGHGDLVPSGPGTFSREAAQNPLAQAQSTVVVVVVVWHSVATELQAAGEHAPAGATPPSNGMLHSPPLVFADPV